MSKPYQALKTPPAAHDRGGIEVLRCAIIEGELHVTLRPAFNDPNDWGRLFAEAARQVARAYAHEKMFAEDEAMARISASFDTDVKTPPDVTSSVGPIG